MKKPTVLIFASYYWPGFKAGGPIRSIDNMIQHLGSEFRFLLVTRDRDLGDTKPYTRIERDQTVVNRMEYVHHLAPEEQTFSKIRRFIFKVQPDVMYFNSFHDPEFTVRPLILHRFGLLPRNISLIVAPRGEFAPGALALNNLKKRVFFHTVHLLRLYQGLIWQASSVHEEKDIRDRWGKAVEICISPNLPPKYSSPPKTSARNARSIKTPGRLSMVCVARVARNKNISGALRILKDIKADVEFTIYGPLEDNVYWDECQSLIQALPQNVSVRYQGEVNPQKVVEIMSNYDLFFFPTHGENFGHVILEALLAGCPLLLSDQTPWRGLSSKKIGFDVSLSRPDKFQIAIEKFVAMSQEELKIWSRNARDYGRQYVKNLDSVQDTRRMLNKAIAT